MYAMFFSHTKFMLTKQAGGGKRLIIKLLGFYCY